jgi:mevalonate kinase
MKDDKPTGIFYSKIMLFGEYSILKGSMGLTIPYGHFNGELAFINKNRYTNLDFARHSNHQLREYWNYLNHLKSNDEILCIFNTSLMKQDLEEGLYFESTIPEGYGLGSSGALVAALYDKYVKEEKKVNTKWSVDHIKKLKMQLAQLESYFHGTSSGIDPLICYLKHPLLLKDLQYIEPVGIPPYDKMSDNTIFLLNSGKPWKTAPLVDFFMNNYDTNETFQTVIDHELTPLNNQCIKSLINNDITNFFQHLKILSEVQLNHLAEMIPASIAPLWAQGIKTDEYYLKLCGSGGGGFVLGFTRNYTRVKETMHTEGLEIIPVYQDRWEEEAPTL